jgi:hypothetical protein
MHIDHAWPSAGVDLARLHAARALFLHLRSPINFLMLARATSPPILAPNRNYAPTSQAMNTPLPLNTFLDKEKQLLPFTCLHTAHNYNHLGQRCVCILASVRYYKMSL